MKPAQSADASNPKGPKLHVFFQPGWDDLKGFGNSKLVKGNFVWFYVIPVVVLVLKQLRALDKNDLVQLMGSDVIKELDLPFAWELLYFCSLFFFVAALIFQWRCPRFIKEYDSYSDFLDKDGSDVKLISCYLKMRSQIRKEEKESFSREFYTHVFGEVSGTQTWNENKIKDEIIESTTVSRNINAFATLWNHNKSLFQRSRITCRLFQSVGIALLASITIQSMYRTIYFIIF